MKCRQVSNLLSAYLDAELTGSQMLEIRTHLDTCSECREEYVTLRETKHLLSALAMQGPRAELEVLLQAEMERSARPLDRWMPEWVIAWQGGAPALPPSRHFFTAGLSLGVLLWGASALNLPAERPEVTAQVAPPVLEATFVSSDFPAQPLVSPSPLWLTERSNFRWSNNNSVIVPVMNGGMTSWASFNGSR